MRRVIETTTPLRFALFARHYRRPGPPRKEPDERSPGFAKAVTVGARRSGPTLLRLITVRKDVPRVMAGPGVKQPAPVLMLLLLILPTKVHCFADPFYRNRISCGITVLSISPRPLLPCAGRPLLKTRATSSHVTAPFQTPSKG